MRVNKTRAAQRLLLAVTAVFFQASAAKEVTFSHALSIHGQPQHGPSFQHLDYVNPNAPKGGVLRLPQIGTFDTFHRYGPNGKWPLFIDYTHETLLSRNWNEPLTKYGVIVKTIERPGDNSWVAFHLNPNARFHDGKPVTADDVVFSFKTIMEQGSLFWRQFYQDIAKVEATTAQRVLFTFKHNQNRELPLNLGQLPVLASHWWKGRDFSATTLDIPVGSGPYRIKRFQPGRFVEYERVKDYWARNHPVNRGRYNFDQIRIELYRDINIVLEAMNSSQLDVHLEHDSRYWNNGYSKSALAQGKLNKRLWENHNPQTQSLVINSRRPWLANIKVREALTVLLEVDWVLKNLLGGSQQRARSLFAGTDMATSDTPSPEERQLLIADQATLPERLWSQSWPPAQQLGKRERLKYALNLLHQAGFKLVNGTLLTPDNTPFVLELLLGQPALERLMQIQVRRFAEAGITLKLRTLENARYLKHLKELDFDLVMHIFRHTPSPGAEQLSFWSSQGVNEPGTLNLAGINHPVVDRITAQLAKAETRKELVTLTKAMDRLILWQFKVIPLAYSPNWQIVMSDRIAAPEIKPRYTLDRSSWWAEPSKLNE